MDLGLLLLRLIVGGLIFGHGAQKAFGVFGGMGPAGTAPVFESWGLRPGRPLVLLAATCELLGSTLLLLGLATPLGAAQTLGTLAVAAWVNARNGLWAAKGGYELALLYATAAGALAFTGPGRYSIDRAFEVTDEYGVASGLVAAAAALLLAGVFIGYARRNLSQQAHHDHS
ncbi:DoxX family protein [Streptomyces sp. NPDC047081]|uniref:DoxX family protein n=1 Tax=Streptomyces sp. NPDC047081 TaxID=3154706 RepID=UPI003403BEA8